MCSRECLKEVNSSMRIRIQLSAATCVYGDIDANLATIEREIGFAQNSNADIVLFGEAFLQGLESITFNYVHDADVTLGMGSVPIAYLRKTARHYGIGIGVGFYENDHGAFYSSYLVIGKNGEIVHRYRRVSEGWKLPGANADYREGRHFLPFEFEGVKMGVIICGDLWEDHLLKAIADLDAQVECMLWSVHTDYSVEKWEGGERREYIERSSILGSHVMLVNNFVQSEELAKGGAYVWYQGRELAALSPGSPGRLLFNY